MRMAIVRPLNEAEYAAWVAERPESIKQMLAAHPPDRLYRLRDTKQYVTIYSYAEDGTVTVTVEPAFNLSAAIAPYGVFGIDPADLTECDIPERRFARLK
jgi:hypothetical protein